MKTRNTVMGIRMWDPPASPAQVVIVEADTGIRTLLEELLADEGYRVRSRPLPDDLPAALNADPPDLLLLDCLTPGLALDWGLLETLRTAPATATLPIILCTTRPGLLAPRLAWLAAQRIAVLPKPFDLDALLTAVHAALDEE